MAGKLNGNIGNVNISRGNQPAASAPPKRQAPSKPAGHAELSGNKNKVADSGGATKRARVELPKSPDVKEIAKGSGALGAEATKATTESGRSIVADMRALNEEQQKFSLETGAMKFATDMAAALGKQLGKVGQAVKDGQNG